MSRSSIGGSGAQAGITFENRVAAWAATKVLAEASGSPLWGGHQDDNWESICCQTGHHVDDLLINTSRCGRIFIQIKLKLTRAGGKASPLSSSLDQAVRQTLELDRLPQPTGDAREDRIVLIGGKGSTQRVARELPRMLAKARSQEAISLSNVAGNRSETALLDVVVDNIRSSWRRATDDEPGDEDVLRVLSRLYLHVLDLDHDGADRQTVDTLLRTAILREPDQAAEAWSVLVEYCGQLAIDRTEANRLSLQRALLQKGIQLRSPRSYENDIQSLRRHSEYTLDLLSHLAELSVPNDPPVKIERECLEQLYEAGQEQHLLVIGEPGTGKSGVLHALASRARNDQRDLLFMSADRIGSLLDIPLDRLADVLANWFGDGPGLLIIDALDAARSEANARELRDLIRLVIQGQSRWRIVAAIRQFDLRYSDELKELFVGQAIDQASPPAEFDRVNHLFVQRLSDGELDQVRHQSTALAAVVDNASQELRLLLHSPFNLRLITSLMATEVDEADLTSIRTQSDLLERYWQRRVRDCRGQELLRSICEAMVRERELRVDLTEIDLSANADQLQTLLSNHVLQEWQRSPESRPNDQVLTFSHHMLFDYAVARLLLGRPEQSVERLAAEPDLVLAIQPSVMWHFRRLWTEDPRHAAFWSQVLGMCEADGVTAAGEVIGPAVAVEMGNTVDDFEVLTELLVSTGSTPPAAVQVYRYLVGALHAIEPKTPLVGETAGPWCALTARATRQLNPDLAWASQSLLCLLCDKPDELTQTQRAHAGEAARTLFEFAESHQHNNSWMMMRAIRNVCRTFDSSPRESAAMLRRLLSAGRMQSHGYKDIPAIAREIERMMHDVALVADIYRAAFTYDERSDDMTPMGSGQILPLTSTRSQDYRMGTYHLMESFSRFLQEDPVQSTSSLIDIINHYVEARRTPSGDWPDAIGDIDGVPCTVQTDLSHIWDEGGVYRNEDAMAMLTTFQQYLRSIGFADARRPLLARIVQLFAGQRCAAVLWRRLLSAGAACPDVLGLILKSVCWNPAMLKHMDTSVAAGELLHAVYPMLNEEERVRSEGAILGIPEDASPDRKDGLISVRNRLLGCLSEDLLVTPESRGILAQLRRDQQVPPNEPVFQLQTGWSGPVSQDSYLARQGVDVESDVAKRLLAMIEPLKGLADEYLNGVPSQEEAMAVLAPMQTLMAELAKPGDEDLHPALLDAVWDAMAATCERIVRADALPDSGDLRSVLKEVLLKASTCDGPRPDPEADQAFDERSAWSKPAPRVDAAQGLMAMAGHPGLADDDVMAAIERLSTDPKPQVRSQIAGSLVCLYETVPEAMWRIANRLAHEELSRGVLWSLCVRGLHRLAGGYADRVVPLIKPIMDRVSDGPGSERVIEACMTMVVGLHVWQGNSDCCGILDDILVDNPFRVQELHCALSNVREALIYGETDSTITEECQIRQRAFKILEDILDRAHDLVQDVRRRGQTQGWPEDLQNELRPLIQLIDQIGSIIYFASDARDSAKPSSDEDQGATLQQQERFYHESKGIVGKLAHVDIPSVTHHLVQMLEHFIPYDPAQVFLTIGGIVVAGQSANYQYESMAADRVVRLVERYLAEYRWIFRQDEGCRQSLLKILDIFVHWPAAHRLTYRLAEIYR